MRILFLTLTLFALFAFAPASYAQELSAEHQQIKEKAIAGDADAQFAFGKHILDGVKLSEFVSKKERVFESLKWFDMAAKQGHADAQYIAGYLRISKVNDDKTKQEMAQAAKEAYGWFAAANAQNNQAASKIFTAMQEGMEKRKPEQKELLSAEELESTAKEYIALYVTPFQDNKTKQESTE
ncbi:MAG: hypothetical protein ACRBDL_08495 [Alphaproteobacteria bacterium]